MGLLFMVSLRHYTAKLDTSPDIAEATQDVSALPQVMWQVVTASEADLNPRTLTKPAVQSTR